MSPALKREAVVPVESEIRRQNKDFTVIGPKLSPDFATYELGVLDRPLNLAELISSFAKLLYGATVETCKLVEKC